MLATLGTVMLGLAVGSCGTSGKGTAESRTRNTSAPPAVAAAASNPRHLEDDGDADGVRSTADTSVANSADDDGGDNSSGTYYDWDDGNVLYYGHPADQANARAATNIVRRYYSAAARGEGASVCRELSADTARALSGSYVHALGVPAAGAKGCPTAMTSLLKRLHPQLSIQSARLKTGVVRTDGASLRVLLGFEATWPNRYMPLHYERGTWKISSLTADTLP